MKITEAILSLILKKGIVNESRNVDVDFEIPTDNGKTIKINVKCEHMVIRVKED
jgi:hypothetical protein